MTQRISESFKRATAIVDNTAFAQCDAVYIGVGGSITVTMADGTTAAFVNVPNGSVLSVSATKTVGGTSLLALYY